MPRKTVGERILDSIKVTEAGCWEWQGYCDRYGIINVNGKSQKVHRVAWAWFVGPLQDGLCVLHKCDNPPCCNRNHLFIGTQRDNVIDCQKKGRLKPPKCPPEKIARGDNNAMRKYPGLLSGEKNGRSKLTNAQRREIHHRRKNLGETTASLAVEYGVDRSQINRTVKFIERRHHKDLF